MCTARRAATSSSCTLVSSRLLLDAAGHAAWDDGITTRSSLLAAVHLQASCLPGLLLLLLLAAIEQRCLLSTFRSAAY
jgi:hypothetical protein